MPLPSSIYRVAPHIKTDSTIPAKYVESSLKICHERLQKIILVGKKTKHRYYVHGALSLSVYTVWLLILRLLAQSQPNMWSLLSKYAMKDYRKLSWLVRKRSTGIMSTEHCHCCKRQSLICSHNSPRLTVVKHPPPRSQQRATRPH